MANNILDHRVALAEIAEEPRRGASRRATASPHTMMPSSTPLRVFFAVALLLLLVAASLRAQELRYTVDVRERGSHTIGVTLQVDSLSVGDTLFQFAATAPGTYQTMDIGRFVRGFSAVDGRGRTISSRQVSTNQWRIAEPRRVRAIRYEVHDTWHTSIPEFRVYPMAGTALEREHALLNWQAMIGFPLTQQGSRLEVRVLRARDWQVATALREVDGVFEAASYDALVDSPVLMGRLTTQSICVTGVPVQIAVYSPTNRITATQLGDAMRDMLQAAGRFLGALPVDHYAFLFDFAPVAEGDPTGAWEHAYSSAYTLAEEPYTAEAGDRITWMAAHEFFHIVTPLHLHSEIVERFNYQQPVPSRHLWLYEGVTEWAAQKLRQEGGLEPLENYLAELAAKARRDREHYDTTYSLTDLARTSYTAAGARQYGNIYMRGALVAGLLDIRLLELSGGARGLKSLVLDLSRDYGVTRPFPEDSLIDIVVARTYPEIRDFFTRWVEGIQPLPLREYYGKLGITVEVNEHGVPTRFALATDATPEQLSLREAWLHGGEPPRAGPAANRCVGSAEAAPGVKEPVAPTSTLDRDRSLRRASRGRRTRSRSPASA
jgi:predicted metalloprotease with PDZ domain